MDIEAIRRDEALAAAIRDFLAGYPEKTGRIYASHLEAWRHFCAVRGAHIFDASAHDLLKWQEQLREGGLKPSSIAAKLTAVKGLYRHCYLAGLIPADPSAHVDRPYVEYGVKSDHLEMSELVRLIDAASAESPTSHALICLLGLCGLRSGECSELQVDDFEARADGSARLRIGSRNGGEGLSIELGRHTARACREAIGGRTSGPLLPGHDGARIQPAAMRRTLQRLAKAANVTSEAITTQALRRTYFAAARASGVPEHDIAASMGFRSRAMLEYYGVDRSSVP